PEGDGHGEDAGDDTGDHVPQEQRPAGGQQPDDVQDQRDERAHAPTLDSAVPAHQGAGPGWAGREIWAAPALVHTGAVTGRDYPGPIPAPELELTVRFHAIY